MDSNSTCSLPEIEVAFLAITQHLRPQYAYLMMATVFASLLLPFLFALFYFSTARQRQTLMFTYVVAAVVTAIIGYIFHAIHMIRVMYNPFQSGSIWTTTAVGVQALLFSLPSFFSDLALLCRMLAVYPYSSTPLPRFIGIFSPVICFKLARVGSTLQFMILQCQASTSTEHPGLEFMMSPDSKIWIIVLTSFAAIDTGYTSMFFLWKLRTAFSDCRKLGLSAPSVVYTFRHRVRMLFWLSMSSFAFPTPLMVTSVGLVATLKQSSEGSIAYYTVLLVNTFASAICVAFATVWSSHASGHLQEESSRGVRPTLHWPNHFELSNRRASEGSRPEPTASLKLPTKLPDQADIRVQVDMEQYVV